MDTAVTNILNTYLDCVKILVNEPWPDDMEDVLDDVIRNTKTFSEQIKSRKLKSKFKKTCTRKVEHRARSRSARSEARSSTVTLKELKFEGPTPAVVITRILADKNAADTNNGGSEVDNQSANEKLKSTRQDKENAHASEKEIKTEFDECNRKEEDLCSSEDEGKSSSNRKDDGCVIM